MGNRPYRHSPARRPGTGRLLVYNQLTAGSGMGSGVTGVGSGVTCVRSWVTGVGCGVTGVDSRVTLVWMVA